MHAPQYILAVVQLFVIVTCAFPVRPVGERLATVVMVGLNVALMFWGGFYPPLF